MRKKTLGIAIAATAAALVVGSLGLTGTAKADPTTGQTFTTVGSDTIQNVMAALAGQAVVPTPPMSPPAGTLSNVGSYEATPQPSNITPKCGVTFPRPNGSGQGVAALSASVDPGHTFMGKTITNCVQFSRSSGGPTTAGSDLDFVPMGRDAVGYIYVQNGGSSLGNLTQQQIIDYYVNGKQDIAGVTVTPYIPQSGSGTRAFFIANVLKGGALNAIVNQNANNEENTASVIGNLALAPGQGAIYCFSIADYIAQNNGFAPDTGLAKVSLGNPDGTVPVSSGGGFTLNPNTAFYGSSVYGRDVYDVFPAAEVNSFESGTADALLSQFLISPTNAHPTMNSNASKAIVADFGFLTENYDGQVTGAGNQLKTGGFSFIP
jgi:ABC-type phosphate transport system substrate-binding protein